MDGIILKRAVDAWVSAPPAQKASAFAAAEVARWTEMGMNALSYFLTGLTLLLFGLAIALAHSVPQDWLYEGSPFTFVTDGLESAIEQAKAAAGDKDVAVGAASLVQQCIRAGLLEEIHIDLVPVLLGGGVRLFDHLGTGPIELENTSLVEGAGVTHLTFRVVN